ncbi:hypothetical protein [Micromonospora sp. WMMD737]|uniref:hypothetical protein n=1 Tax=Micromonospora sp. WMMD737 TaxID=3404113 RepID=UPI003B95DEA9
MDRIDISAVPGPVLRAARARIVRAWRDGMSLDRAIDLAAADAYATAREAGYDDDRGLRFADFTRAVGAEMRAAVEDVLRPA